MHPQLAPRGDFPLPLACLIATTGPRTTSARVDVSEAAERLSVTKRCPLAPPVRDPACPEKFAVAANPLHSLPLDDVVIIAH